MLLRRTRRSKFHSFQKAKVLECNSCYSFANLLLYSFVSSKSEQLSVWLLTVWFLCL